MIYGKYTYISVLYRVEIRRLGLKFRTFYRFCRYAHILVHTTGSNPKYFQLFYIISTRILSKVGVTVVAVVSTQ